MSKSIFKNVIYKVLLNIFNLIVPLVIGAYAMHTIQDNNMGIVMHAESVYNWFLIFAAFGIYQYGLREVSRIRDDKKKMRELFSSLFVLGIIANVIVLTIFFTFTVVAFKGTPEISVLLVYGFSIFCNIFYVEWANEALEKYKFITIKTIIVKIVYIVLLLTLVKCPDDYVIYTCLLSLTVFLNNIISFVYIFREIGFTKENLHFKNHIKFLIITVLMSNANILYTQLDRMLLKKVSDSAVAYYGSSQNIAYMVFALILSVVYVTIPRLSNILASNDEEGYENLLNKVVKSLCLFVFPAAVGINILSKEIILMYSGFEEAIPVLGVFTFYMISLGLESIMTNQVMYIKKQEKPLIKIIFLWGAINFLMKIVLMSKEIFSPTTAILTTTIANFGLGFTEYFYAKKVLKIKLNIFAWDKLKYLLISLIFIPINLGVRMVISSNIAIALITVVICALLYFVILLIIKDEIIMTILGKFLNRKHKKD